MGTISSRLGGLVSNLCSSVNWRSVTWFSSMYFVFLLYCCLVLHLFLFNTSFIICGKLGLPSYSFLAVCAVFCVSRQWCGCQYVGLFMCAHLLMHVIAYGGCKNWTWGDKFFATLWSWTCISIVSGFSFWHPQLGHLSYICLLPSLFILTLPTGPAELRFSPSLPLISQRHLSACMMWI